MAEDAIRIQDGWHLSCRYIRIDAFPLCKYNRVLSCMGTDICQLERGAIYRHVNYGQCCHLLRSTYLRGYSGRMVPQETTIPPFMGRKLAMGINSCY